VNKLESIHLSEIPIEIKQYVGTIHSIRFPRQGYTSDVGIIDTSSGMYALKRTTGKIFNSWLHKEVTVINLLDSLKAMGERSLIKGNMIILLTDYTSSFKVYF
jgi:hypothetical protein